MAGRVAVIDANPRRDAGVRARPAGEAVAQRNAKGYGESWRGYRLHIDAADGDVPVSRLLTSASLHDSQAAIPLARMTGERVDHRYGLMDAACDSREIGAHARMAGRVAVIDANPRRDAGVRARLAGEAVDRRMAGHVRHDRARHRRRPAWSGSTPPSGTRTADGTSGCAGTPRSPATRSSACSP